MNSHAGIVLNQAAELKIDLEMGIHINEYRAMIVLEEEKQKLTEESEQNGNR